MLSSYSSSCPSYRRCIFTPHIQHLKIMNIFKCFCYGDGAPSQRHEIECRLRLPCAGIDICKIFCLKKLHVSQEMLRGFTTRKPHVHLGKRVLRATIKLLSLSQTASFKCEASANRWPQRLSSTSISGLSRTCTVQLYCRKFLPDLCGPLRTIHTNDLPFRYPLVSFTCDTLFEALCVNPAVQRPVTSLSNDSNIQRLLPAQRFLSATPAGKAATLLSQPTIQPFLSNQSESLAGQSAEKVYSGHRSFMKIL